MPSESVIVFGIEGNFEAILKLACEASFVCLSYASFEALEAQT